MTLAEAISVSEQPISFNSSVLASSSETLQSEQFS